MLMVLNPILQALVSMILPFSFNVSTRLYNVGRSALHASMSLAVGRFSVVLPVVTCLLAFARTLFPSNNFASIDVFCVVFPAMVRLTWLVADVPSGDKFVVLKKKSLTHVFGVDHKKMSRVIPVRRQ